MRVLIVNTSEKAGGAAVAANRLMEALINNGVNILAVSKRLGHANVSITLNVYSHLMDQTDNDMMVKIDEIHQKCCQNVVSQ